LRCCDNCGSEVAPSSPIIAPTARGARMPGADGSCVDKWAAIRVLHSISHSHGFITDQTRAAPRSVSSWCGAIMWGKLWATKTVSGSFKVAMTGTPCGPGPDPSRARSHSGAPKPERPPPPFRQRTFQERKEPLPFSTRLKFTIFSPLVRLECSNTGLWRREAEPERRARPLSL
jgi:hypothetical protein